VRLARETILALPRSAGASRAWDRRGVLASALVEDALCPTDRVLNHALIRFNLFDRRSLGQQLDRDLTKLDVHGEATGKSSLFQS
jgi:hypothetical protein